jgi:hypothetical protein
MSYNPKSLAFPRVVSDPTSECDEGMDLRTYLAAQAMAGLLANSLYLQEMAQAAAGNSILMAKGVAMQSVLCADALIAELNKPTNEPVQTTPNPEAAKEGQPHHKPPE